MTGCPIAVVATPLFGWLCDAAISPWCISASGAVLIFICFGLIGRLHNIIGTYFYSFGLRSSHISLSILISSISFTDFTMSIISFGWTSYSLPPSGPVPYFPFFDASFGSVSGSLILQGQLHQGSSDKKTEHHLNKLSRLWFLCTAGSELWCGAAGGGGGGLP